MKKYLFVFLSLVQGVFLLVTPSSASASDYHVLFCERCNYDFQFETVAMTKVNGTAVVVNPLKGTMRAYFLLDEPGFGDWGVVATPVALPAEMQSALTMYNSIKESLEDNRSYFKGRLGQANNLNNLSAATLPAADFSVSSLQPIQSSSSQPNGCGGEGSWANPIIPQYPFLSACNAHDICYSGSESKAACDTAFLQDMRDIAKVEVANAKNNAHPLARKAVEKMLGALLEAHALASYAIVDSFGDGFYCGATQNTSSVTCARREVLESEASEFVRENLTDFKRGYKVRCELWRFPNGNGGYYYLERNCQISY